MCFNKAGTAILRPDSSEECGRRLAVDGYSLDGIKVRSLQELMDDFDVGAFVEGGGDPARTPYHHPPAGRAR